MGDERVPEFMRRALAGEEVRQRVSMGRLRFVGGCIFVAPILREIDEKKDKMKLTKSFVV